MRRTCNACGHVTDEPVVPLTYDAAMPERCWCQDCWAAWLGQHLRPKFRRLLRKTFAHQKHGG